MVRQLAELPAVDLMCQGSLPRLALITCRYCSGLRDTEHGGQRWAQFPAGDSMIEYPKLLEGGLKQLPFDLGRSSYVGSGTSPGEQQRLIYGLLNVCSLGLVPLQDGLGAL
ncbi:hypothetical protein [Allorhizocola rhizosphaerae]|uniref:hypothetical protein n=1 Tax=Allorhizocola rhizosphaerae TaxID=1872709 RepID=UPI001B8D334D|nr:hypothetical protein [Allorhizocola rhizosphaerae]